MVGIVFLGEIYICPYLQKYIDILEEQHQDYEIICWDRSGASSIAAKAHIHVFTKASKKMINPILKIKDFLLFGKFARGIIYKKKYDKLVILTTLTGIFLYPVLMRKYQKKYIFDYRDVSYEFLPFFGHFLKKIVTRSAFTCISSEGFKSYLPKNCPYVIAHNFRYSDLARKNTEFLKRTSLPIHVSYIGVLRESEYLMHLMDVFGKDDRFLLHIHGGGNNEKMLSDYARQYHNVVCTGQYEGDEKLTFINEADILCYNYPCSFINNPALANKYYDGLIFKKPFFANCDTYSGKLIKQQNIGLSLTYDDPEATHKLYDYYKVLDEKTFLHQTTRILDGVVSEDNMYLDKIRDFFVS